jgi:hypothetical protein
MHCRTALTAVLITTLLCSSANSGEALLELEAGGHAYVGRSLRHNQNVCWLLAPDGRLHGVPIDAVTSFRKVSDTFRPIARSALRSQLREELGREYDVTTRSKFVIAAPDGTAEPYAELLDRVYRSFVRFFSRRSLRLSEPEVPLVVIVFPDVNQFADYCRRDNVAYSSTMLGYYQPDTNRVALYDPGDGLTLRPSPEASAAALLPLEDGSPPVADLTRNRFATIRAGLRDTLVHEATHQLAFNTGLHTRIGENPRWVVEGLALIFEQQVPATSRSPRTSDVNENFYVWFNTRVRPDWKPGTLRQFLASDRPFAGDNVLDTYSIAWALTYYLSSRRSADYATFLNTIRARDVSGSYAAEDRLSDFQDCFGDDIDWLEVEMLRYIDALEG